VRGVAFASDGRHIATANANGTVYIFRLFPRGSRLYPQLEQAWLEKLKGLSTDEQVHEVVEQLKKRNPGFDGQRKHQAAEAQVVRLELSVDEIDDVSPIGALSGLKQLVCNGTSGKCKFRDLWPLAGLKLEHLAVPNCPVESLEPLEGMPLTMLVASYTQVDSFAPLAGMPLQSLVIGSPRLKDLEALRGLSLESLRFSDTPIADLSPLEGMPLKSLSFHATKVRDFAPLAKVPLEELSTDVVPELDTPALREHATLRTINGKPAAELWEHLDAR
jgi:hypothetical protein